MAWRSLSQKNEFQRIYEEGVKQVGRFLVVYLLPVPDPEDQAQAVVASKKVGGAVKRNRAKRLLREALFQARRDGLLQETRTRLRAEPRIDPAASLGNPSQGNPSQGNPDRYFPVQGEDKLSQDGKEGLWVVLVARQRILGVKAPAVRAELEDLLRKLGNSEGPASPTEGRQAH